MDALVVVLNYPLNIKEDTSNDRLTNNRIDARVEYLTWCTSMRLALWGTQV